MATVSTSIHKVEYTVYNTVGAVLALYLKISNLMILVPFSYHVFMGGRLKQSLLQAHSDLRLQ